MSRYFLSHEGLVDLDGIAKDFARIPKLPAMRIGHALQEMLASIAQQPQLGMIDREYSDLGKCEVRWRVCQNYVLYYVADARPVLILAVLHGKRDVRKIMRQRLG